MESSCSNISFANTCKFFSFFNFFYDHTYSTSINLSDVYCIFPSWNIYIFYWQLMNFAMHCLSRNSVKSRVLFSDRSRNTNFAVIVPYSILVGLLNSAGEWSPLNAHF